MKKLFAIFALVALFAVSALAEGNVPYINKADFDKKVANSTALKPWKYLGNKPAIIDFTASWCPPCKKLAPVLDELAGKFSKDIVVYKVDVDDQPELAKAFGVQTIPTLLFIPMSGEPQRSVGFVPLDELEKRVNTVLLKKQK